MSKKIEITDEMVERATRAAMWNNQLDEALLQTTTPQIRMRRALEAALNPPQEPEIVVTEEMLRAGLECNGRFATSHFKSWCSTQLGNIYRAMRKLEPPPAKPMPIQEGERRYARQCSNAFGVYTREAFGERRGPKDRRGAWSAGIEARRDRSSGERYRNAAGKGRRKDD